MQQQVSKGLATWAGIVGAAGQYAGAVALFLADPDKATGAAPLATATATLAVTIAGRMSQAKAQINAATWGSPDAPAEPEQPASSPGGAGAAGAPAVSDSSLAPFTPDGDPAGDDDEDPLAQASDESWVADPSDPYGRADHAPVAA